MSFWNAVVIIVAIVAFANIRMAKYRARELRRIDGHPDYPPTRNHELEREVEALRARIQVLERIATDGRKTQALAAEIESLRED
jgi:hypothetical protein